MTSLDYETARQACLYVSSFLFILALGGLSN